MSRRCQRQVELELQSRAPVSGLTVPGPFTGCRPLRPPPRTGREPPRSLAVVPSIRIEGTTANVRRVSGEARAWLGRAGSRVGRAVCNGSPGSVSATISAHLIGCQAVVEPPIPGARTARVGG